MEQKARRPIRAKILRVVVLASLLVILVTGIAAATSLKLISDHSEVVAAQLEANLLTLSRSKAAYAKSELERFRDYTENCALFINDIYKNADAYPAREIPPLSADNAGTLILQRQAAGEDIDLSALDDEAKMLANTEVLFQSVLAAEHNRITSIYIGTVSGQLISYDRQSDKKVDEPYYNYFDSVWYRAAEENRTVTFTDPYLDAFGRGITLTCTSPVYDAEGRFAGAVAVDILIADICETVLRLELEDGAYAFLVGENDTVIVPNSGRGINGYGSGISESLIDHIQEEVSGVTKWVPSVDDSGEGEDAIVLVVNSSSESTVDADDSYGEDADDGGYYFAYSPIENTTFEYGICVPVNTVLSTWNRLESSIRTSFRILFALMLLMIPIEILILSKVVKSFTKPILTLRKDAGEISSGNFDYRAKEYDNDEIGDLAESFNNMAASLKTYVADLEKVTAEKERIGAELNIARQIQADMLPAIFPVFSGRAEFDIYATMEPAKEVGGDFYDFFFIDKSHLALVIADVSGKGVPAALFMVIAKTLIETRAQMGSKISPAEILADVNRQLCVGNEAMMFVTVWLGIIDIETGRGVAANAGHEHPAVRKAGDTFRLIMYRHSAPLAVSEKARFEEHEFVMSPGDSLFVYTDGVAEASDEQDELFGLERMTASLNRQPDAAPAKYLANVREDIVGFVKKAPQFDDITMLGFTYYGTGNSGPGTELNLVEREKTEADENGSGGTLNE